MIRSRHDARPSALFLFLLLLTACEGPTGPSGAEGEAGPAGKQGPMGTSGERGPPGSGVDAGGELLPDAGIAIQASCLSPCHGFNGVVSQFQTSAHYLEYLTNAVSATPETEWTTPGVACGNCHADDGLAQRAASSVATVDDGSVTNVTKGELEYLDPTTGMVNDALYAGSSTVAEVYCTTCHAVTPANDPHRTGIPWTPGSFPFVVSAGADAGAFIEKSATNGAVTGMSVGNLGPGNTCVWCHKSRKDVTHYILPAGNVLSTYWGPHEGPQADVFSAVGGYEYAGQTYGTSTHQLKLSCVDCHMAPVAANQNVGDHSFAPSLSVCLNCHAGATSFDINGGQTLDQTEMFEFEADLNAAGDLTRSVGPLTAAELIDGQFLLDSPRAGAGAVGDGGTPGIGAPEAGALYNYLLIARGGGNGVHNPKYTQQLIYDSIFALTNAAPVSLPVRPE
jgi:hypothetical protein